MMLSSRSLQIPSAAGASRIRKQVVKALTPQGQLCGAQCPASRSSVLARGAAPDNISALATSGNDSTTLTPIKPPEHQVAHYIPKTEASEDVLSVWRRADAVCFDVDCTITINDSLDLLAEFMGCGEEVEELTSKAMDGSINLQKSLEQRLDIINCTPADIKRFIKANPPKDRLVPGIEDLIKVLQARGVAVYLISGGFRELMLPIAAHLGVPKERVLGNRMMWQWDDETNMPTKLVGFDVTELTAHNRGKPAAIARIRQNNPYNTIVMVGDGITDLEAVQSTGGADLFIGYGGVIERPSVASQADWFVYEHETLLKSLQRYQVACIGSGAWASAALRMVAQNTSSSDPAQVFEREVRMWVHGAKHEGRPLTEVINETHQNAVYLPGVELGDNVVAMSDLEATVKGADCIIMCVPHQFMHDICKKLQGKIKPGAIVCSLTKGMHVKSNGPQLISSLVQRYLRTDCCVLMGANIAEGVAQEQLSEGVIGYVQLSSAKIWQKLFKRPYFNVELIPDVAGAEMCGTLKNVVAIAAGLVDGLGAGANSKAAVIREGLHEMRMLSKALYPTVRDDTFLATCGVGDLVATCYGGRNRLVAEAWAKARSAGNQATFEQLEKELLNGQKLQGVLTSDEVQEILKANRWEAHFPLFTTVNRIINNQLPPEWIYRYEEGATVDLGSISLDTGDELELPKSKPAGSPSKPRTPVPAEVANMPVTV